LEFSILNVFVQRGALILVKYTVFVQVILIKNLFGRRTMRSAKATRISRAAGTGSDEFIRGQFAIAVLIELGKRSRGVGDLVRIYDAVAVCVESGDDGWRRGSLAIAAWRALVPGRALTVFRRAAGVLRCACPGGHNDCH
jgi:hypothetical protein